jgi:hypothetical protein
VLFEGNVAAPSPGTATLLVYAMSVSIRASPAAWIRSVPRRRENLDTDSCCRLPERADAGVGTDMQRLAKGGHAISRWPLCGKLPSEWRTQRIWPSPPATTSDSPVM